MKEEKPEQKYRYSREWMSSVVKMSSFLFQWQPWRGRMGWAATARRTATTPHRRKGAGPLGSSTQGTACWDQVRQSAWIQIRIGIWIQHFKRIRIRIQCFDDQKLMKKNTVGICSNLFWSKIAIYLSLGLHKGRPSCWKSLQPSKENIQHFKNMKILNFATFVCLFCPPGSGSGLWIRVRIQGLHWIRTQSGSGSTTLLILLSVRQAAHSWFLECKIIAFRKFAVGG